MPNPSPLENPLVASPLMHVDMHNKFSDDLISLPLTKVAFNRRDAVQPCSAQRTKISIISEV